MRSSHLLSFWVLFFGGLGGLLGDLRGALAGVTFALLPVCCLRVFAEPILARLLGAEKKIPAGWQHSFDRAVRASMAGGAGANRISLRRVSDPRPWILGLPSWRRGRGTLFISQGLAASCDEPEFRQILNASTRRLGGGQEAGDAVAVLLQALILRALPRGSGPTQALLLLLATPILRALRRAANGDAPPTSPGLFAVGSLLDTETSLR